MQINILPNQRIFIAGMTRTGKSFLVFNVILPLFLSLGVAVVIYDFKWEIHLPGAVYFHDPADFAKNPNQKLIIYQPRSGSDQEFNLLCARILIRKNTVFLIDDISTHAPAGRIQIHQSNILRLGASLGIGNINLCQEATGVNNFLIKQANHYFVFRLPGPSDREKMVKVMGEKVLEVPPEYHFWYFTHGMPEPVLMKPVTGSEYYLPAEKRGRSY
jgi:hypothetical protein